MYNRCRDKSLVQAVVGKYDGRPQLSLKRTIDGRKQGRRFKAVSANETQRVRIDCFVRLQSVSDIDYCDLRKPLCHLYTYNRRSGSLKAHFDIILATTVSFFAAKTSQWSRQSYQKCSDARKSFKKLASRTGRRHFVQDESSDARFRSQKFASKAVRQHFVREGHSDARESRKKLASAHNRRAVFISALPITEYEKMMTDTYLDTLSLEVFTRGVWADAHNIHGCYNC